MDAAQRLSTLDECPEFPRKQRGNNSGRPTETTPSVSPRLPRYRSNWLVCWSAVDLVVGFRPRGNLTYQSPLPHPNDSSTPVIVINCPIDLFLRRRTRRTLSSKERRPREQALYDHHIPARVLAWSTSPTQATESGSGKSCWLRWLLVPLVEIM